MSLHSRIMNVRARSRSPVEYRLGHKQARHDAAEIASEIDAKIQDAIEVLIRSNAVLFAEFGDQIYTSLQRDINAMIDSLKEI